MQFSTSGVTNLAMFSLFSQCSCYVKGIDLPSWFFHSVRLKSVRHSSKTSDEGTADGQTSGKTSGQTAWWQCYTMGQAFPKTLINTLSSTGLEGVRMEKWCFCTTLGCSHLLEIIQMYRKGVTFLMQSQFADEWLLQFIEHHDLIWL